MDLLDFFRRRYSWRKLEVLLRQLPTSSAFVAAQLDDPEVAAWLAEQPDSPSAPSVTDWTPSVARLTDIYDRLGEVVAAVIAAAGGKPPKMTPAARPRTEVDRLKAKARKARHDALVAEVEAAQERYERGVRRRGPERPVGTARRASP